MTGLIKTGKKRGFTLIELLVVIAIIAILASILFPVFARARDNARRSSCMSNLKQVALGLAQYTQDNDNRFPPVEAYSVPGGKGPDGIELEPGWGAVFWQQMVYPYVKSHQIFFCPSSPARPGQQIASDPRANSLSYMLNANYSLSSYVLNINEAKIVEAASSYMAMEYGFYVFAKQDLDGSQTNGSYYLPGIGQTGISCANVKSQIPEYNSDCMTGRHFGGVTVAFADGHVKWLPTSKVKAEGLKGVGVGSPGQAGNGAWDVTVPHT